MNKRRNAIVVKLHLILTFTISETTLFLKTDHVSENYLDKRSLFVKESINIHMWEGYTSLSC